MSNIFVVDIAEPRYFATAEMSLKAKQIVGREVVSAEHLQDYLILENPPTIGLDLQHVFMQV